MNLIGLRCLLDNIEDDNPEIFDKEVETISIIKYNKKEYLHIKFKNGMTASYDLYEPRK